MQQTSALAIAAAIGLAIGIGAAVWPRATIEADAPTSTLPAPPLAADAGPAQPAPSAADGARGRAEQPRLTSYGLTLPSGAVSAAVTSPSGTGVRVRVERFTLPAGGTPTAALACDEPRHAELSGGATLSGCGDGRTFALLVRAPWDAAALIELEVVAKGTISSPYAKRRMCGPGAHFLRLPRNVHAWTSGGDAWSGVGSCAGAGAGAPDDVARELVRSAVPAGAHVVTASFQNTRAGASFFAAYAAFTDADAIWLAVAGGPDEEGAGFVVMRWPRVEPPADVPFGFDNDAKVAFLTARCPALPCSEAVLARAIVYGQTDGLRDQLDRCVYACRGEPAPPASLAPVDLNALAAVLGTATAWPPDWKQATTPERPSRPIRPAR
jgi:hypothetical protein